VTLGWILAASVAGGTLSAAVAALAMLVRVAWVPMLVSYAIGALLGAAFLEVIPHAFEKGEAHQVALAILGGIFAFFVLEKLLLWRHCHTENCEVHDPHDHAGHAAGHDHGRSGTLIVVGDTVHNFVDGVLIAAAFSASSRPSPSWRTRFRRRWATSSSFCIPDIRARKRSLSTCSHRLPRCWAGCSDTSRFRRSTTWKRYCWASSPPA
jgi:zinc transporter ZupT